MDAVALPLPAREDASPRSARGGWTVGAFASTVFVAFVGCALTPVYSPSPWWSLLWIGPVLYASYRAWRLGRGWVRLAMLAPLVAFPVIASYDLALPWWGGHVAMATVLVLSTVTARPLSGAFGRSFLVLIAVAALRPWVAFSPLGRFWLDCLRLRPGMTMEQVFAELDGYYVQDATTSDGCKHLRVSDLPRLERSAYVQHSDVEGRPAEEVILYPNDGAECDSDGCWTWFVDGRLEDRWLWPD